MMLPLNIHISLQRTEVMFSIYSIELVVKMFVGLKYSLHQILAVTCNHNDVNIVITLHLSNRSLHPLMV